MIAHSAPCLLQDTFLERSDGHLMRLCRVCGDAAGLRGASDRCVRCGRDDTTQVRVPYAYKLLMQELMAMGIRVQMRTST
jgi:DNA-directed RNA polymerase beta subunit